MICPASWRRDRHCCVSLNSRRSLSSAARAPPHAIFCAASLRQPASDTRQDVPAARFPTNPGGLFLNKKTGGKSGHSFIHNAWRFSVEDISRKKRYRLSSRIELLHPCGRTRVELLALETEPVALLWISAVGACSHAVYMTASKSQGNSRT